MSTPAPKVESSSPDPVAVSEKNPQNGSTTQPQQVSAASPGDEEGSGEEWETIGYEETEEGRKAKHMLFGHFQIKRKKKRLFSYHWNVRKY
ncbi:hypothetical protein NKR19_g704 [Coniochaeta hoffmannii]|uniref:Uncharacterized protein n=1 Tax=Coniochaeta hoffmannii TaxID=91930 RepID=A0AA38SDT6_9PEZI|nr:hypothetical protein NKR19_g704 [Coniochaeta hoffmannii]